MVTHIGDLQSDLYEEFATIPDTQNHLLVSSRQNRRLLGSRGIPLQYLSKHVRELTPSRWKRMLAGDKQHS